MDISLLLLLVMIFIGLQMFFSIRRQRKAMQATIDLHESLAVDDRVHTASGLEGTIRAITEDTVDLEIAVGVVTTWRKMAIADKIVPEHDIQDDAEYDTDDDYDADDYETDDSQEIADGTRSGGADDGGTSSQPQR